MLNAMTKKIVLGNIQLLNYCMQKKIDISKLNDCNIERMDSKYIFVLPKKNVKLSLDNDIDSQPSVVLTMDVSADNFNFEETEWTDKISEA